MKKSQGRTMRGHIRVLLEATQIEPDGSVDTNAVLSPLINLDMLWRAANKKWLRDLQIIGPYFEIIAPALRDARKLGTPTRLVDILDEAGIKSLEDELLDFLNSLPRQYFVHFPIRIGTNIGHSELKIGDQLSICSRRPTPAGATLGDLFSSPGLGFLSKASLLSDHRLPEIGTSLRVPTSGYIDSSADDSGVQTALAVMRQFVGMSIASRLMVFERATDLGDFDRFEAIDRKSQKANSGVLPVPVAALLKRVTFPADLFESSGGVAPSGSMTIATRLTKQIDAVVHALSAPKEDGQHLRTAAEWLFDSEAESNETAALLFASIGLEAALDSPAKETTDRLGDRLAWSLGTSLSERKRMAEEYREFYRVRCDVAHGRERRLDDIAREKLTWGRSMLRRIIAKELDRPHS
jgi:hypothetical protein